MPRADGALERFSIAACGDRWLDFAALAHETLLPVTDFAFSGDELLVRRDAQGVVGRVLAARRVPRPARAPLLLQASAAAAFFAMRGFPLGAPDFDAAVWDGEGSSARLWLTRTPESVRAPAADTGSVTQGLLVSLRLLFSDESGRISPAAARELAAELESDAARWKRGEHWVASVLRRFPELMGAAAASARERCPGYGSETLRRAADRALAEKARAILRGRAPRVFEAGESIFSPGSALRLTPPPEGRTDAARRLRALAAPREGRPPTWIAVAPETWDETSRAAFESARHSLGEALEVAVVPGTVPVPDSPADWRRAVWIPCGALAGSVRFYEWLAGTAPSEPSRARAFVRRLLAEPAWAAFAADATGDAPLPALPDAASLISAPPGDRARAGAGDRGWRIERLLEEGQTAAALREAESWIGAHPARPAEAWFPLVARLAAGATEPLPAWLEEIEAERERAGGRAAEAKMRLDRLARRTDAKSSVRRRARLRAAEIAAQQGRPGEAARRAAEWRRMHPEAPASECVRCLRLGAAGFSREGRVDCALALLDEAERLGRGLPVGEVVETALSRAEVFALAGRFEEEGSVYDGIRSAALGAADERVAARFLAQEARGLLDRREHARAIVRFEEAIAASAGEPSERAALLVDLSTALYHSGKPAESEATLGHALQAAASAGREDLVRLARGNRVELLVNRGAWEEAAAEIERLAASARAEKDTPRLLVALHHRSRLALRRGFLEDAARDNAEARRLADEIGDRLEIGELRLEDGDRLLLAGDLPGALALWELAAAAPPDRCDRDRKGRLRLIESGWRESGGIPSEAWQALETEFGRDAYSASETVARWSRLFGEAAIPARWRDAAAKTLRASGGTELAARVFGRPRLEAASDALRPLRHAVVAALAGDSPNLDGALGKLGLEGLAVRDDDERAVLELGALPPPEGVAWHALTAGAARFAFAVWPPPPEEILAPISLLLETLLFRSEGAIEALDATDATDATDCFHAWRRQGIVTADGSMEEPYRRLARFAPQEVTVVVLGESGSGKEAVARAIHRLSRRSRGPFAAVNVAAIPNGVLESELFGHARGAFTGADRERRGLLEEAAGGTVFFDEIGDLDLALQVKLLRALQERELRRVGENRPRPIDVRIVSATSRDLPKDVEAGRFREDLFYRLHVAVIRLPPLRERGRDTLLLARHFLERYAREYGKGTLFLAPETLAAIAAHSWPGNVRELQNAIAQAAALCDPASAVTPSMLPDSVRPIRASTASAPAGGYRARVDAHRRDLIADALDRAGGNRSRAARDLGLSRQALLYLIRELKVEVKRS